MEETKNRNEKRKTEPHKQDNGDTKKRTSTKNGGSLKGRFCGGAECRFHRTTFHGGYIVNVMIWILGLQRGRRLGKVREKGQKFETTKS
jgi:hypothetical protein